MMDTQVKPAHDDLARVRYGVPIPISFSAASIRSGVVPNSFNKGTDDTGQPLLVAIKAGDHLPLAFLQGPASRL